jgi:hypothetical protein
VSGDPSAVIYGSPTLAFLMKHCPQCGAEYDDYVQFCFVDGVALVEGPGTAPKATLPYSTPLPAPQAASIQTPPSLPPPAGVRPALAASKERAPGDGRGLSLWAVGLLLVPVILLFGVGGLIVAVVLVGTNTHEAQGRAAPEGEPRAAEPRSADPGTAEPHTTPPPSPTAPSPAGPVRRVTFESIPPGAEVWEGEVQLCDTTPCTIEHPDYAPDDRKFTLRLKDFQDTEYVLLDPDQVQTVELSARPKSSRPRPKSGDDILIQR